MPFSEAFSVSISIFLLSLLTCTSPGMWASDRTFLSSSTPSGLCGIKFQDCWTTFCWTHVFPRSSHAPRESSSGTIYISSCYERDSTLFILEPSIHWTTACPGTRLAIRWVELVGAQTSSWSNAVMTWASLGTFSSAVLGICTYCLTVHVTEPLILRLFKALNPPITELQKHLLVFGKILICCVHDFLRVQVDELAWQSNTFVVLSTGSIEHRFL